MELETKQASVGLRREVLSVGTDYFTLVEQRLLRETAQMDKGGITVKMLMKVE